MKPLPSSSRSGKAASSKSKAMPATKKSKLVTRSGAVPSKTGKTTQKPSRNQVPKRVSKKTTGTRKKTKGTGSKKTTASLVTSTVLLDSVSRPNLPTSSGLSKPSAEGDAPRPSVPLWSPSSAQAASIPIPGILLGGDYPEPSSPLQKAAGTSTVSAPIPETPTLTDATPAKPTDLVSQPFLSSERSAPANIPCTLWVDARDPFSLMAHWEFSEFASTSAGHSVKPRLRVYAWHLGGVLMTDQEIPSGSSFRVIPVLHANTVYWAELGCLGADGLWHAWFTAEPVRTPADTHTGAWALAKARFQLSPPTITSGSCSIPTTSGERGAKPNTGTSHERQLLSEETSAQRLTALVWEALFPQGAVGSSAEIAQWVTHLVSGPTPQTRALPPSGPSSPSFTLGGLPVVLPSSPAIPVQAPAPGFSFRVNAELIVYGSTEPDATVTLAGKPVKLRPDGSFSFRFSLPDGHFDLPALAVKADRSDCRSALLQFSRSTQYTGEVGVHPQDPTLQPPVAERIR